MDALRRKTSGTTRTAKPRGPVPPTLGSSEWKCDFGLAAETQTFATEANKPGTPGRSRSKP